MNKLPIIKIKKPKKNKSQLNILSKSKNKINPKKSDENKEKEKQNNASENNYSIAIDYYTKNINNDEENTTLLIKRAICYLVIILYH